MSGSEVGVGCYVCGMLFCNITDSRFLVRHSMKTRMNSIAEHDMTALSGNALVQWLP